MPPPLEPPLVLNTLSSNHSPSSRHGLNVEKKTHAEMWSEKEKLKEPKKSEKIRCL